MLPIIIEFKIPTTNFVIVMTEKTLAASERGSGTPNWEWVIYGKRGTIEYDGGPFQAADTRDALRRVAFALPCLDGNDLFALFAAHKPSRRAWRGCVSYAI